MDEKPLSSEEQRKELVEYVRKIIEKTINEAKNTDDPVISFKNIANCLKNHQTEMANIDPSSTSKFYDEISTSTEIISKNLNGFEKDDLSEKQLRVLELSASLNQIFVTLNAAVDSMDINNSCKAKTISSPDKEKLEHAMSEIYSAALDFQAAHLDLKELNEINSFEINMNTSDKCNENDGFENIHLLEGRFPISTMGYYALPSYKSLRYYQDPVINLNTFVNLSGILIAALGEILAILPLLAFFSPCSSGCWPPSTRWNPSFPIKAAVIPYTPLSNLGRPVARIRWTYCCQNSCFVNWTDEFLVRTSKDYPIPGNLPTGGASIKYAKTMLNRTIQSIGGNVAYIRSITPPPIPSC